MIISYKMAVCWQANKISIAAVFNFLPEGLSKCHCLGGQQRQVGDRRGAVHSRHDTPVDRLVGLRDTGARPAGWGPLKTRVGACGDNRYQTDKTHSNKTADNSVHI